MIAELVALAMALDLASFATTEYRKADRAVDNWRLEAARAIDSPLQSRLRDIVFGAAGGLPRCIRLNNYWCVKSAGWTGEIATDGEGHVAFASAHDGAVAAAQLLRRYYVDYGRKSALAIISRWAPAECAPTASRGTARKGLRGTLRARWLAANRGKVAGRRAARVRSRIAEPTTKLMRAPSIAVGMGEQARPLPKPPPQHAKPRRVRLASLGASDASPASSSPRAACASEAQRIRNYAVAMAKGVADGPKADLKLFDADGRPTPALRRAMANMAAVEIGPYAASGALIDEAVAAHARRVEEQASAD